MREEESNEYDTMNTLFVGNLLFAVQEKEVREKFGRLKQVRIAVGKVSGKSLGYAFVEFVNRKDAEDAIKNIGNMELNGRRLRLNWKKPINNNIRIGHME